MMRDDAGIKIRISPDGDAERGKWWLGGLMECETDSLLADTLPLGTEYRLSRTRPQSRKFRQCVCDDLSKLCNLKG